MMLYNQFNRVGNKFLLLNQLFKLIQIQDKEIKLFQSKIFLLLMMEQKDEPIKEKHLYHQAMEVKAHYFQLIRMEKIFKFNH